jgi:hypothetical protein
MTTFVARITCAEHNSSPTSNLIRRAYCLEPLRKNVRLDSANPSASARDCLMRFCCQSSLYHCDETLCGEGFG